MLMIGLTGSIGMGKSQTAKLFAELGIPVYDADAAVHALYAKGGEAAAALAPHFESAVQDGAVDRAELGRLVLNDPAAMRRLESIVHPMTARAQLTFLKEAAAQGAAMAVLDIPLLFETGATDRVDVIAVVSAPPDVQRARVLQRPGMTPEKFAAIVNKQTPDGEKRARAHFVIETGLGVEHARAQVRAIANALRGVSGQKWERMRA
jgi:dephospho-CoA kinase